MYAASYPQIRGSFTEIPKDPKKGESQFFEKLDKLPPPQTLPQIEKTDLEEGDVVMIAWSDSSHPFSIFVLQNGEGLASLAGAGRGLSLKAGSDQ